MKLDKRKLECAMANSCMNSYDLAEKTGLNYQTVRKAPLQNVKPRTAGLIAKALGVDVTEILEEEAK